MNGIGNTTFYEFNNYEVNNSFIVTHKSSLQGYRIPVIAVHLVLTIPSARDEIKCGDEYENVRVQQEESGNN